MNDSEFVNEYNALDKDHQEILQLLALIYEPDNISRLIQSLRSCGLASSLGKKKYTNAIRFLERKFLVDTEGKIGVNRKYVDRIIRDYCLNNPHLHDYRQRISEIFPIRDGSSCSWAQTYQMERIKRDFRIAVAMNDDAALNTVFQAYDAARNDSRRGQYYQLYLELFNNVFSAELMVIVPDIHKAAILDAFMNAGAAFQIQPYLETNIDQIKDQSAKQQCIDVLAESYLQCGQLQKLTALSATTGAKTAFCLAAFEFLHGNLGKAKALYTSAIKTVLGRSKRKYCPSGIHRLYFAVLCLATDDTANSLFLGAMDKWSKEPTSTFDIVNNFLNSHTGADVDWDEMPGSHFYSTYEVPFAVLLLWVIDQKQIKIGLIERVKETKKYADAIECEYLGYQCHIVLSMIGKRYKISAGEKEAYSKLADKYLDLSSLFTQPEAWKKSMSLLKNIAIHGVGKSTATHASSRLVWFVYHTENELDFQPREQTLGKSGKWSKGRPVALKRVMNRELKSMTPLDKQIANCIKEEQIPTYGYYYDTVYNLETDQAMPYFLKHPYLFLEESPTIPVELVKDEIRLIVGKNRRGIEVSLSHALQYKGINVVKSTQSRFVIIEVTDVWERISKALGKRGKLVIPKNAEPELQTIVRQLSSQVTIHSDLEQASDGEITTVKADPTPRIQLVPVGEGIRAEFFVRPFKDTGHYCKPGAGGKTVIGEVKGKQKQAVRNLRREKELAKQVMELCPSLSRHGDYNDIFDFTTSEECLDALIEFQHASKNIIVEWPEGEKLRIRQSYTLSDVAIQASQIDNWFDVSAALNVDKNLVLNMKQLIRGSANSRFIELGDGEFIALTNELRNRLERLGSYSYFSGDNTTIHPLNLAPVDELLADFDIKRDRHWKRKLASAKESLSFQPALPSTFQAELRPYQLEGYEWLSRLAHWGAGACLADDMGLGKTIQALAVIVERATEGPSLVVAPASVCMNWISESNKFTPSLNTILFGSGNRKEVLKNLQSFDLVVCSYGLLLHAAEMITGVQWRTTVLDEAQAIKNFKAKRTQAALNLKSGFRLITTGTPVENHLSEFWTLFSFVNPGLLGTHDEFTAKFAVPIESDNDAKTRNRLRDVIRPFLLRRTKSQVLEELPPKTEIDLLVDMSDEEAAFYEALRQTSVARIEGMKEEKAGAVHLQVLAELTRLRQACCHANLVNEEATIESTKLATFLDIVTGLKENRHKALVFSQFTGHLGIICKICDDAGITYQYLDGSTPVKERQRRIDAFRAGDGDIFLLSLKAGGVGLNLTVADYVIHMDPWWNPAVEDQASDRAHRIGQQKPVTIYRLITRGTVEEKIINLHQKKRDLAKSLLEGTDLTGKMTAAELMNLIH